MGIKKLIVAFFLYAFTAKPAPPNLYYAWGTGWGQNTHDVFDYYGYATASCLASHLSYTFLFKDTKNDIFKSDMFGTAVGAIAATTLERHLNGELTGLWGVTGNAMFYFPVTIQIRIRYHDKHKKLNKRLMFNPKGL